MSDKWEDEGVVPNIEHDILDMVLPDDMGTHTHRVRNTETGEERLVRVDPRTISRRSNRRRPVGRLEPKKGKISDNLFKTSYRRFLIHINTPLIYRFLRTLKVEIQYVDLYLLGNQQIKFLCWVCFLLQFCRLLYQLT